MCRAASHRSTGSAPCNVYGALTAILAGRYAGVVKLLERAFVALTGESSDATIVLTLFALAAVFTPLRNTLQAAVDRFKAPSAPAPAPPGITGLLRELGELRDAGLLTAAEFEAKKAELLQRL